MQTILSYRDQMRVPVDRSLRGPLLWCFLAAGLGLRAAVLLTHIGTLESDGAVVGLMARRLWEGEVPAFYWGQPYGGSLEAVLTALAFMPLGPSSLVLRLVPMLLSAVVAYLCYLVGRELVGESAARTGALLVWVAPAAFLWWSAKPGGTYWPTLCLALLAVLLLRRMPMRNWSPRRAALFGAVAGLSFWSNPQSAYYLVPIGVVSIPRLLGNRRVLPVVGIAGVLGALPWIIFNARYHFASLPLSDSGILEGYMDRLGGLFSTTLPMALGLMVPFTRRWVPAGVAIYGVLALLLAAFLLRWWRRYPALAMFLASYPFLYALSPFTYYVEHPRYLLFLWPMMALAIGRMAVTVRFLSVVVLAGALAGSIYGLREMGERRAGVLPYAPDVLTPASFDELTEAFEEYGIRTAFANYWVAYRATFEAEETAVLTPISGVRYEPYDRMVRRSDRPAYVFLRGSQSYSRFMKLCRERGIAVKTTKAGAFLIAEPNSRILPEEITNAFNIDGNH